MPNECPLQLRYPTKGQMVRKMNRDLLLGLLLP